MKNYLLILCNGKPVHLNPNRDPSLESYLNDPRSQVDEMLRQINRANYYKEFIPKSTTEPLTMLDLGANLGLVSLFAVPVCKKIVAIEPEVCACGAMARMLRLYPNTNPLRLAVAGMTGQVRLSTDLQDFSCSTITNPKAGNPTSTVDCFTLSDLMRSTGLDSVDLCKVDIEGAEMEVLTEATISEVPVKKYYLEFHKTPGRAREYNGAELTKRFQACGFEVANLRPNAILATRK